MSGGPGLLVAVEGIDGSGKSHVSRLVVERLSAAGLRAVAIDKHSLALADCFAGRRMAELRRIIWPAESEPDEDRLGTLFYLYLLAAWYAGLRTAIAPAVAGADIVILDGSFHRVIAKAHIRAGLGLDWLASLFEQAPRPDLVILLDVEPALAWRRRAAFKATELGRWDGHAEDAGQAFARYQGAIRAALVELAGKHGWCRIAQAAGDGVERVAAAAHDLILERLRRTRGD